MAVKLFTAIHPFSIPRKAGACSTNQDRISCACGFPRPDILDGSCGMPLLQLVADFVHPGAR